MALKIISFIFVISLAFCITAPNQVKDVPFNMNNIINQISTHHSQSSTPPSLTPDLTGEFLIDTNVVHTFAPYYQDYPSVAFDGQNYLIVWEDWRSGDYCDIYGARISQEGVLLDSGGIAISTATRYQFSPSVAFDGQNYLVVWEDWRSECDIYGARVTPAGIVLDPAGIAISTAEDWQYYPSVAFDGQNYLVVWGDQRNGPFDIYGTRVTQDGVVLDPTGIAISTVDCYKGWPSVAFSGVHYLVVWDDYRNGDYSDIYGARVSRAGIVLDSTGIALSTAANYQYSPSVAFDGENYLVAWEDWRNGNYPDIYGARISQEGVLLDSLGIAISTAADSQWSPSVTFGGQNYLVAWEDRRSGSRDIYVARISPVGDVLDSTGIAITTTEDWQWSPAVAFDSQNYLVVWGYYRVGWDSDIYGTRISQTGIVLDTLGILVSTTTYGQYYSVVAFDGQNYLVVWQDWRSECDIYGARVTPSGMVLDPTGIVISTAEDWQQLPSLVFGGQNYLVAWEDWRNNSWDIYGARVSPSGVALDPTGIAVSTAANTQQFPSVAFGGENYFVVWQDWRRQRSSCDIYGARISQAGNVLDPAGIVICSTKNYQFSPSVAFDGQNYLVVWEDYRGYSGSDIYGARISQTGVVLDPDGFAIAVVAHGQYSPSVAFDGQNYLVVWEDYRYYPNDIYCARVSQNGIVIDTTGIHISTALGQQARPVVVFDGQNYLVVWEDERRGEYDIYGARINPAGTVIDSFPVSIQRGNQFSSALARGNGNQVLITYSGWTDSINGHPANTMRIWGKFYPFIPGIAEENSKVKMQSAKLLEIYPNPFSRQTAIRFTPNASRIELKIYDISGKLVKTFVTNLQSPVPSHCLMWNGTDDSGKKLPAGVYFCCLKTTERTSETKEIIIMK